MTQNHLWVCGRQFMLFINLLAYMIYEMLNDYAELVTIQCINFHYTLYYELKAWGWKNCKCKPF